MTYEIKDLEGVIMAMFDAIGTDAEETTENAYTAADSANDAIFWHMMDELRAGNIDAIETRVALTLYTYTRSAQHVGAIQRTAWMTDASGDLLPLSHCDIYGAGDTSHTTNLYTPGIYNTITY